MRFPILIALSAAFVFSIASQAKTIVATVLKADENRLDRSQPSTPTDPAGGGKSGCRPGGYLALIVAGSVIVPPT